MQRRPELVRDVGDQLVLQAFAFAQPVTAQRVRLFCSKLDQLGKDFVLQLAEIEVAP